MRLALHNRDFLEIHQFVLSFVALGLIYAKFATYLAAREFSENLFSMSFGAIKVFMEGSFFKQPTNLPLGLLNVRSIFLKILFFSWPPAIPEKKKKTGPDTAPRIQKKKGKHIIFYKPD